MAEPGYAPLDADVRQVIDGGYADLDALVAAARAILPEYGETESIGRMTVVLQRRNGRERPERGDLVLAAAVVRLARLLEVGG